jgi:membrane-bound lytic murein transglycosylase D
VFSYLRLVLCIAAMLWLGALPSSVAAASVPDRAAAAADADELYTLGQQLFEYFAPEEVREQFDFTSREQWNAFAARLQRAFESGSLEELAGFAPEVRTALTVLRAVPEAEDLADWLQQRLDQLEAAQQAIAADAPPPARVEPAPAPGPVPPQPAQPRPRLPPTRPSTAVIPHYELWLARVRDRPVPARADPLLPTLRAVFIAEGVPPELVWVAEAESSFNPLARSPVGAKGLFQLMPETARSLGLRTVLPDDRTDPEKSARAAARYLRMLYGRFGSWPLALAAYNAGQGRVSRALIAGGARDYAGIAHALPAETRMYVPKVCALIATRAGVPPDKLAPPRS